MSTRPLIAILILLVAAGATAAVAESDGQALYEKKCGLCHGKDGVAKKMAAGSANLNDPEWQKTASVEAIVKVTTEGKGKMPKSKLSADELKLVAEYVLTLK